jgi:hypothetical protein
MTTRDLGGEVMSSLSSWRGRRLGKKGDKGTRTTTMEEEKLVTRSWQSGNNQIEAIGEPRDEERRSRNVGQNLPSKRATVQITLFNIMISI